MLEGRPPATPPAPAMRQPVPAILAAMSEPTEHPVETELEPRRAAEMHHGGEAQLIDVRQESEWRAGHIAGALHVPLETLPERASEIGRDRPVIFQCRTGVRSAMATQAFRASGLEAFNLTGGLEAWVAEGLEIEPAEGGVAKPLPDNS
jgi:rhodanese-related sulfurtransferase